MHQLNNTTGQSWHLPSPGILHHWMNLLNISSTFLFPHCKPLRKTSEKRKIKYQHHGYFQTAFLKLFNAAVTGVSSCDYLTLLSWQATATCVRDESRSMSYKVVFSTTWCLLEKDKPSAVCNNIHTPTIKKRRYSSRFLQWLHMSADWPALPSESRCSYLLHSWPWSPQDSPLENTVHFSPLFCFCQTATTQLQTNQA